MSMCMYRTFSKRFRVAVCETQTAVHTLYVTVVGIGRTVASVTLTTFEKVLMYLLSCLTSSVSRLS